VLSKLWIGVESGTPPIKGNVFYLLLFCRIDIVIGLEGGTVPDCEKSGKIGCFGMIWVGEVARLICTAPRDC